jgi:NDP-sugar pyrophosphorylase family protein
LTIASKQKIENPKILGILEKEISKTQVLILAGGSAKRMGLVDKPKPLLQVAGKPLIDRCIEFLKDNGFKDFTLLVGYKAEQIMQHVGNGEKYGVKVRYCLDPKVGNVGKAKALKHAIETGAVDTSRRSLIAFPDDVFTERTLVTRFLLSHVEAVNRIKVLASIVLVSAIDLPYGVAKVDSNNIVTKFKEKPTLNILTSAGLYILEPEVYKIILQNISLEETKQVELEETILPMLAEKRKLYAFIIPRNTWLPVNTLKELEQVNNELELSEVNA